MKVRRATDFAGCPQSTAKASATGQEPEAVEAYLGIGISVCFEDQPTLGTEPQNILRDGT